jgi:hypothetical protein
MRNLVTRHDLKPEDVERIEIRMNSYEANYPGIKYLGPFQTEVQCGMSAAFCMAVFLIDRKLYLSDASRFDDPRILSLCKVTKVIDDESIGPLGCRLTIGLKGGQELKEVMDITPEYYFYDIEKVIKVMETIHEETGVPPSVTRGLMKEIKAVETWPNVKNLTGLFNF